MMEGEEPICVAQNCSGVESDLEWRYSLIVCKKLIKISSEKGSAGSCGLVSSIMLSGLLVDPNTDRLRYQVDDAGFNEKKMVKQQNL